MGLPKFLSKMICSFSYDFDVFYKTIIENLIFMNVFPIQFCHIGLDAVYGFKHVLQSFLISNWLSHRLVFYHG